MKQTTLILLAVAFVAVISSAVAFESYYYEPMFTNGARFRRFYHGGSFQGNGQFTPFGNAVATSQNTGDSVNSATFG